jgi:hypothetical protein
MLNESFDQPLIVMLTDPTLPTPPTLSPDCQTCAGWELERRRAEANDDLSRAVDCRIQIRRHASHGV